MRPCTCETQSIRYTAPSGEVATAPVRYRCADPKCNERERTSAVKAIVASMLRRASVLRLPEPSCCARTRFLIGDACHEHRAPVPMLAPYEA